MQIKGYSAIVTGGASGLGAATARALAQQGAKVAILDMDETKAKRVAQGINGIAIQCNVSDDASVQTAMEQVLSQMGAARICVNCAGIVHGARILGKKGPMPVADFARVININLLGTFNVLRLAVEAMATLEPAGDDQERGVIINTASVAAFEGQLGQIAYSASKGAVAAMTLPAARELAQHAIRVMTIAPGLMNTPMFDSLSDTIRAELAAGVPFPKRLGKASEFADLVVHIVNNPLLNGSVIRLDGAVRLP